MASSILELIVISLKLVYTIIHAIIKWNLEERLRFEERIKTVSMLLKEAVENKDESLNEDSYLSNLEWEMKQRYETYKEKSLEILRQGGGIVELENVSDMGMGLRIQDKKENIIQILLKNLDIVEKSKWIAKEIIEI